MGWFEKQTPLERAFYFFNHCLLNRSYSYQPRKIKYKTQAFRCFNCGKDIIGYVLDSKGNIVCYACKNKNEKRRLCGERQKNVQKAMDSAAEFEILLENCENKGTCDILTSHHELLKNDNNRLRTEYLLKLICKNDYEDVWENIKKNVRRINTCQTKES